MKVKDLIAGMEGRAMDAQFQKDICALYDTKTTGIQNLTARPVMRSCFPC